MMPNANDPNQGGGQQNPNQAGQQAGAASIQQNQPHTPVSAAQRMAQNAAARAAALFTSPAAQGTQGNIGSMQANTASTTTVNAMQSYTPPTPNMGGAIRTSPTDYIVWTGGEPTYGWTGLKSNATRVNPSMYRPLSAGSSQKSQAYRIKGMEDKFHKGGDLLKFGEKLLEHLEHYGMDTISYLPCPLGEPNMLNVIKCHSRYNLTNAKAGYDAVERLYDEYDVGNNEDALLYLSNSLEDTLLDKVKQKLNKKRSFAMAWMHLSQIVQVVSVDKFQKIKDRIRERSATDYECEDISKLSTDFFNDFQELHSAAMYEHGLTLTMLKTCMQAGGAINEDYRHALRSLKTKLSDKLMEKRLLDYKDSMEEMEKEGLDPPEVLRQCEEAYHNVKEEGKWPAAAHAKDTKKLPRNYGSANMAKANALVQSSGTGNRDKSQDKCHNCGKIGHWARDCRSKGNGKTQQKSPRDNPKKKGRFQKQGKHSPPKAGESEIKHVNGTKLYWCAKCKRWNKTHSTDGHKSKEELKAQANMSRVSFDMHPAAFKCTVRTVNSKTTQWTSLLAMLLGVISIAGCC